MQHLTHLARRLDKGRDVPHLALLMFLTAFLPAAQAQEPDRPAATFRSSVEMVTINAVVRDHKGRVVSNLTRADFQLFDNGRPQSI